MYFACSLLIKVSSKNGLLLVELPSVCPIVGSIGLGSGSDAVGKFPISTSLLFVGGLAILLWVKTEVNFVIKYKIFIYLSKSISPPTK